MSNYYDNNSYNDFKESDIAPLIQLISNQANIPKKVSSFIDDCSNIRRFKFYSTNELLEHDFKADWVIDNFLSTDSLSTIFGSSGIGKSFMALDMGFAVAAGLPWHGNAIKQGSVFYIAGEGGDGIKKRLLALEKHYGVSLDDIPFYTSNSSADLSNETMVQYLHELIKREHRVSPRLIIIDTLARNIGEFDENSNKEMGTLINLLDRHLRVPFKANVMLIHHTGKDTSRGARGASALRAALDQEFLLKKKGQMIEFSCTKMKDSFEPESKLFSLKEIKINPLSSSRHDQSLVLISSDTKAVKTKPIVSGLNQEKFCSALERLSSESTDQKLFDPGGVKILTGLDNKQFSRTKKRLVDLKVIVEHNGMVGLTQYQ